MGWEVYVFAVIIIGLLVFIAGTLHDIWEVLKEM